MRLEDLVRPNIQRLVPYSSARHEFTGTADVFLDANESPYPSELNRYPDPYQARLKSRIAELKGLSEDQIFLGNGSDEAIDLMIRIFCEPRRDEIMILPPTYGMYKVAADIADVWVTEVPLIDDFQLDVDMIPRAASGGTKLLFICSPNNPTGNLMSERDVRKVLREFLGVVVIDEAYADFVGHSWTSRLDEFENLIVMQTLSKAWGLAGIRLGMAFAHPKIIRLFNAVKPPYNVNVLTQTAASRGCPSGRKWKRARGRFWPKEIAFRRRCTIARW